MVKRFAIRSDCAHEEAKVVVVKSHRLVPCQTVTIRNVGSEAGEMFFRLNITEKEEWKT